MPQPNIALVYDWVNAPHGGAEKVLQALHTCFPQAPLFTAVYDQSAATWAQGWDVRPSWLQTLPGSRHHRWLAGLLPLAFESFDLREYDLIISVTSTFAKGILTKPNQLHLCYLLTPPRFLYSHHQHYQRQLPVGRLAGLLRPLYQYLTWWDQAAMWRPDITIPISKLVKKRTEELYIGFETKPVIYPPVEPLIRTSLPSTDPKAVIIARLVGYKRLENAIEACVAEQIPLTIIGDGPARHQLEKHAQQLGGLVTFLGAVPDKELGNHLEANDVFLMPGLEDFGITAVEAAASGLAVIIHRESGAAELLQDWPSVLLLPDEKVASVKVALRQWQHQTKHQAQTQLHRKKLHRYDTTRFCQQFAEQVAHYWLAHRRAYNEL